MLWGYIMRLHSIESMILLGESGNETEDYNEQYTESELKTYFSLQKFLTWNFYSERKKTKHLL